MDETYDKHLSYIYIIEVAKLLRPYQSVYR
jgi:hypothetical protein